MSWKESSCTYVQLVCGSQKLLCSSYREYFLRLQARYNSQFKRQTIRCFTFSSTGKNLRTIDITFSNVQCLSCESALRKSHYNNLAFGVQGKGEARVLPAGNTRRVPVENQFVAFFKRLLSMFADADLSHIFSSFLVLFCLISSQVFARPPLI